MQQFPCRLACFALLRDASSFQITSNEIGTGSIWVPVRVGGAAAVLFNSIYIYCIPQLYRAAAGAAGWRLVSKERYLTVYKVKDGQQVVQWMREVEERPSTLVRCTLLQLYLALAATVRVIPLCRVYGAIHHTWGAIKTIQHALPCCLF